MNKAQELFDQAVSYYNHTIRLLRQADEAFQKAAFRGEPGRGYDTQATLAQYDMILQAALLSTAVSDGRFDPLERQFVEQITRYGDLLAYLRRKTQGKLDLSWQALTATSRDDQRFLVEMLPTVLDQLCDSFVQPMALVDRAVPQAQLIKHILQDTARICACLSMVDGVNREQEREACIRSVSQLLGNYWQKYMG